MRSDSPCSVFMLDEYKYMCNQKKHVSCVHLQHTEILRHFKIIVVVIGVYILLRDPLDWLIVSLSRTEVLGISIYPMHLWVIGEWISSLRPSNYPRNQLKVQWNHHYTRVGKNSCFGKLFNATDARDFCSVASKMFYYFIIFYAMFERTNVVFI